MLKSWLNPKELIPYTIPKFTALARSRLILQVHDELLIEAWEEEVEQVKAILKKEMERAAVLSVQLEIDMKQGRDWYEAH